MTQAATILKDLIAIPSVNPMGREPDANCWEGRVSDYLANRLGDFALHRVAYEPGRDNLLVLLPGAPDSDLLVWEAHQDTVPVEGMTVEPFTPQVRDGRLYGRGACDVKGGMAAMLAAFERIAAARGGENRGVTLMLALSVNEEFGGGGAKKLAEFWRDLEDAPHGFQRQPNGVIVAEPTQLNVVAAHKGVLRWRCRARGKAAHSSTPELGHSAVYDMARAVLTLERYQREVLPHLASHPQLSGPTLSVGLIAGGVSVNVVPEVCGIEIDRRLIPGETPEAAWRHVCDFLRDEGHELEHDPPYSATLPLSDRDNGWLVERIQQAGSAHGIASQRRLPRIARTPRSFPDGLRWCSVPDRSTRRIRAMSGSSWSSLRQRKRCSSRWPSNGPHQRKTGRSAASRFHVELVLGVATRKPRGVFKTRPA